MKIERKKVWLYWLAISAISSITAAAGSMLYWHFTYKAEPNVSWTPINDIAGMYMIMPLDWLMSLITPAGWLNVLGLGLALWKKSPKPLVISAAGSILFALYWPKVFVGMMGI